MIATVKKDPRPTFPAKGTLLQTPMSVVDGTYDYLAERATELFVCLFVDARNRVIGYTELTSADISSVTVHPAGIFREALLSNAAAILTIHNHPTGDATPSSDDHALWKRLRDCGDIMGIPILDNMVIGTDSFFSQSEDEVRRHSRGASAAK